MTNLELRQKFFDYFKSKGHAIIPSSPIAPLDDPTLLFTTAGMVQFKPIYAGIKKADYRRAASVQKCFRLSDLENIGKTLRHHTFFEMFGNFAFMGDYFKKEAIEFAWEFSTEVIGLPKEKIYVSVFEDDDRAFELWNEHIGLDKSRIVRLGKKDNFWGPAGSSGACGPCSELYIDMGQDKGCGDPDCYVGCDCERYLEFWNLVFNEFFQDTDGAQTPLPNVGIDTGMGLERLCYITQGVESNYQTDVMKPIVQAIVNAANVKYEGENKFRINLIADHFRALVFVISENIVPSNEGRGYVLRRLLRNALKTASDIGMKDPFLYSITESVVSTYKSIYDYLPKQENNVKDMLLSEEKRFYQTILSGLKKLDSLLEEKTSRGNLTITGSEAFTLFDTFGLPIEITVEEANKMSVEVDTKGFEQEMGKQKSRSRGIGGGKKDRFDFIEKAETEYLGDEYEQMEKGFEANVLALYTEDGKKVEVLSSKGIIITDRSPFYGEMGGQVGDIGVIKNENFEAKVIDTKKKDENIIHIAEVVKGSIKTKDKALMTVDTERRNSIRRNHTTTHILQRCLINKFGDHIKQAGSFVSDKQLRFDFTHFKCITDEELREIENEVNAVILKDYKVEIKYMSKDEAIKYGALAFFDEKYGEKVRTLSIGENFSKELCGGSHLEHTSQAGYFHIISESSIASGVRRIEAAAGHEAVRLATEALHTTKTLMRNMNALNNKDIFDKIDRLNSDIKKLQKENKELRSGAGVAQSFIDKYENIDGVLFFELYFEEDPKNVKEYLEKIKEKHKEHIAVVMTSYDKAHSVFVQTASAIAKKYPAGAILKKIQEKLGGRGGGKETFAQGSLEKTDGVKSVIEEIKKSLGK